MSSWYPSPGSRPATAPHAPKADIHQSQLLSMWAIIEAAVSGVLPLTPIIFIMSRQGGGGGKEWLPCVVCGNWTLSGPGNLVLVRQGKYLKSRCAFASVARNSSLTHPLMGPRPFLALRYRTPSWFLGAQRANLSCQMMQKVAEQSNLRGIKTWNES